MNFRQAYDKFKTATEDKFIERNERHQDQLQIGNGCEDILELEIEDLWCHFYEELHEFEDNEANPNESFDVSNMAFLIWWHMEETNALD